MTNLTLTLWQYGELSVDLSPIVYLFALKESLRSLKRRSEIDDLAIGVVWDFFKLAKSRRVRETERKVGDSSSHQATSLSRG
jgi:hypothetical protein